MIRLVGVELTRLRWRRAAVLLLVAAIAIPTAVGLVRAWSTRPVSEDRVASVVAANQGEIERCVERPRRYGLPPSLTEEAARERCEQRIVRWHTGREELSLGAERAGSGIGIVAVITVLLMLLGTTFAGHDWNSGSMSNQLLFEPRRGRVWAAKALAVTLVAAVTSTVVCTAYWLALAALMRWRDLPTADGALTDSLMLGLRGAALATAAALGGYALTMLLRSTVATIGVLFAVAVAGGLLLATFGVEDRWQPYANASAIINNGATYYVEVPEACFTTRAGDAPAPAALCDTRRRLSAWHGVGYLGTALVVTVGASVLSFRRRDVP